MFVKKLLVLAAVLALGASACGGSSEPTVKLGTVAASVVGDVVTIPITVDGIEIVKANGDTSGKSGHFHVFVDSAPVAVSETIEKAPNIVHTAEMPIVLYGQSVGKHTYHIVLGDGTHKRIDGSVDLTATVDVKGPTVDATAPATIASGADLKIDLKSSGINIVKADGDASGKSGHYHVLVDPASAPKAGETIPAPVENKIVHTTESSVTLKGLANGEHTIFVVVGDGNHKALPIIDKLTVTVG